MFINLLSYCNDFREEVMNTLLKEIESSYINYFVSDIRGFERNDLKQELLIMSYNIIIRQGEKIIKRAKEISSQTDFSSLLEKIRIQLKIDFQAQLTTQEEAERQIYTELLSGLLPDDFYLQSYLKDYNNQLFCLKCIFQTELTSILKEQYYYFLGEIITRKYIKVSLLRLKQKLLKSYRNELCESLDYMSELNPNRSDFIDDSDYFDRGNFDDKIDFLNDIEKEIITYYYYYGESEKDIAEIINRSQQYVSKIKQIALNKLKS